MGAYGGETEDNCTIGCGDDYPTMPSDCGSCDDETQTFGDDCNGDSAELRC